MITVRAPGRVNIIGDHTDYTGGLCLPMAIDRGIEITGRVTPHEPVVRLVSDSMAGTAVVPLDLDDVGAVEPAWARYAAAVVMELRPKAGFDGAIRTTLPSGVGLSSSAALEVAVALALGADPTDQVALARTCQAAEHAARDVATGILDQLSSIAGRAGHGLLLDCHELTVRPVPMPSDDEVEWVVIVPSSGRELAASAYGDRVRELAVAEAEIGPLRLADLDAVERLADPLIRRRARHVVTENRRVEAFAEAISAGDLAAAGALMDDSHASLRDDFQSSTATIDDRCVHLRATPGVFGARITGGGWGGCVIALTRPGALGAHDDAWVVRPSDGARILP